MTRYDVYRKEVDTDTLTPDPGIGTPSNYAVIENGKSCNYTAGVFHDPKDDPNYSYAEGKINFELDRRILRAAVVNCEAEGPLTGSSSNHPNGVHIEGIVNVFLTEPAFIPGGPDAGSKDDTNFDIWGELVAFDLRDNNGLKDVVQLYR